MTTRTVQLDRIPPVLHTGVEQLASLCDELAGDKLLSLTVFGDALTANFDPDTTPAGSVLVLKDVDLNVLRRLAERGVDLGKHRVVAPLIMTPQYIKDSLDTFPLELLEIHRHHTTVMGEDYFEDLDVNSEHLRLQCEREFKRILIRLRQGMLAAAGRQKQLNELAVDVGAHLLRSVCGLLWLKGVKEAVAHREVIEAAEKLVGQTLTGLRAATDLHPTGGWANFEQLYNDAATLARLADEL